jgi:cell wall-associated NlpC family hydrolase
VATNPTLALVAYNCGNPGPACQTASAAYAAQVLATAASFTAAGAGVPSSVQAEAVSYAESQIGTPYVYGGDTPASGFDCSGLVIWAYGLAGVAVPRVANDQWHDEPHVALGQLVPGDLVFFGAGDYAEHVGIYIGNSAMVDAPHTGADVRIDTIDLAIGASLGGGEVLLGAADPVAT